MSTSTIKILAYVEKEDDEMRGKNLLPSIGSALKASSLKIHETQLSFLSDSLNEMVNNLQVAVSEIRKMKNPPSKISFSLGLDGNGEIGIMSTISGSISHGASITVEFDVKKISPSRRKKK